MDNPIVIAIGLIWNNGNLVVGKRPEGMPLGGFDELPGGKCLPNESPEQAVVRECLEETGITVQVTGHRLEVVHAYRHGDLRLVFFDCQPVDSASIYALVEPFRWASVAEVLTLRFPEANRTLIESLRNYPKPL